MSDLSTDPAQALAALTEMSTSLHAAVGEVTDADALSVGERADTALSTMVDSVSQAIDDPTTLDATAYAASITEFQDAFSAVGEVCAG
jgi:hypothetical protein